ncbi:hypothetical protein FLBR109950_01550 [Flavobacterium branchiophilum]|uniref:Uncharacterized protein n=2 Tax=Flavobacterium branchiophilum TaxID=55197 RepID=G2Z6M4_FLABF|nr:hypothetical protein [Flavobacterium branchiophilum]PDS24641.1 hypothetical protein B0A77_07650 [Flavobacterium branchiophilum]CCB68866.1 Hypothetical protein precursor [Flavobacterium branchiophilum FL-15]
MKAKLLFLLSWITLLGYSQEKKQLFHTPHVSRVVKNIPFDLDANKGMLVYGGGSSLRKALEKINYFDLLVPFKKFAKDINQEHLQEKLKTAKNLEETYEIIDKEYKQFMILYFESDSNDVVRYRLYKPGVGNIFIVEDVYSVQLIGITAGNRYLYTNVEEAMYNEIVNYIRQNSKMYQ